MHFEKCLTCPAIQKNQCSGPKFMRAPSKEIVEWLFAYMKLHGITNAHLAEVSGIPKGTIDGLKKREDVRHETMLPLLKTAIELTGGSWEGNACPLDRADLEQQLDHAKELLAMRERVLKERTRAIYALFGLCVGLVALLLLICL